MNDRSALRSLFVAAFLVTAGASLAQQAVTLEGKKIELDGSSFLPLNQFDDFHFSTSIDLPKDMHTLHTRGPLDPLPGPLDFDPLPDLVGSASIFSNGVSGEVKFERPSSSMRERILSWPRPPGIV